MDGPVLVFFRTGSCSFSNSTLANCRGEFRFRSVPAAWAISSFEPAQIPAQLRAQALKQRPVDSYSLPFHIDQHFEQRHLYVCEGTAPATISASMGAKNWCSARTVALSVPQ